MSRWIDDIRPNVRYTTCSQYQTLLRNHIEPRIGRVLLAKLSPAQIQGVYSEMEREGIGGRTRQATHTLLHAAFEQAAKWGMIPRNACSVVERPKHRKRTMDAYTQEEAKQFLEAAREDRLYAIYVLAVTTGMRQGELLGLQWEDVDLAAGTISIQHNLIHAPSGKMELAEPKSPSGRRLIHLPRIAVDALSEHRKTMVAEGNAATSWVFCNRSGGYIRREHFYTRCYQRLLQRSGCRHIRFHDLRHTCASLLLLEGVHPKVVQERLGHSTFGLTLDTYSHVMPGMQKQASEKLDRLQAWLHLTFTTPTGSRTPVTWLRTMYPRPLDDGGTSAVGY